MLNKSRYSYIVVVLFALFIWVYYAVPFSGEFESVFLSITTFTFSIFAGFFISRQGSRQSAVRDMMANFDGTLSFIYRAFGHFSKESQRRVGEILRKHYEARLKQKDWAYYFMNRSTLLTDMHAELDKVMNSELIQKKGHAVNRALAGLLDVQKIRKSLVSLYEERVPAAQWLLMVLLAAILLVTISILPSQHQVLASILKAAFSTAVLFVLIILIKFDQLSFFENAIGEHSARDVLDIIKGKK